MILSVGLSPAWQKILVFDSVRGGEVNRARIAMWCASGKVLNAGMAVHTLGGRGLTMAPVGGPALRPMEEELRALGMAYRFIETEAATRVCTTVVEEATGDITELVEEGQPLSAEELSRFRNAYREESRRARVVVMMGSLPQGTPVSFYRELLERTRCPMVLDFRGDGLLSVLDLAPLVVKPNREELEDTVGHPLKGEQALCDAMRLLNGKGARWVVITEGAASVWLSSATEIYRIEPPRIAREQVVNPIGSGDAMAGAMALRIATWGMGDGTTGSGITGSGTIENEAIENGASVVEAVRWGIAAAAQNVRRLLPCRLDPASLATAAARIQVERLE
uniref:Tagatose 6-phosphate kinase n=1 Tax=Candidatus Kentrum sp. LFY TaxID=2126342 RepID=A0A450UEW8_9GAMM|nr:MAG: tagatose 6-phosphate kinase [Candidatus Kentron sp. LFY]